MTDKRIDVDKHVLNMGDYGKNPASRHQIHKDSPIDRNPYMDKVSYFLVSCSSNGAFTLNTVTVSFACFFSTLYGKEMQLKDPMMSKSMFYGILVKLRTSEKKKVVEGVY